MKPKQRSIPQVVMELEPRLAPAAMLIKDFNTMPAPAIRGPDTLHPMGNIAFFIGYTNTTSSKIEGYGELWVTDGTSSGTNLVRDIMPGAAGSKIRDFTELNGVIYFAATNLEHGEELWRSDGTSEGTYLVRDINPGAAGSSITKPVILNDKLYFGAIDATNGGSLWSSDGTSSGTTRIAVGSSKSSSGLPRDLVVVDESIYFTLSGSTLMKYDAATLSMSKIATTGPGIAEFSDLINVSGTLFYIHSPSFNARELWRSDGTSNGTYMLKNFISSNHGPPMHMIQFQDNLYFNGNTQDHGLELWKSDGTVAGTAMVRDTVPGPGSLSPRDFVVKGDTLFFIANGTIGGADIWKTDGTALGTRMIRTNASLGYNVDQLTVMGDYLYFSAWTVEHRTELWRTDGTIQNYNLVKDISPGTGSTILNDIIAWNDTLLFTARPSTVSQASIWKSDGTANGTMVVYEHKDANANTAFAEFTNVGGMLYFSANVQNLGAELWSSDGTSEGTLLASDIYLGSKGSNPIYFTDLNNVLYFAATDAPLSQKLWQSDGTSSGTTLLYDFVTTASSRFSHNLTTDGVSLYFFTREGDSLFTLWTSDGTSSGTNPIQNELKGSKSSSNPSLPSPITFTGEYGLFWTYGQSTSIAQLWSTDGTSSGTNVIKEFSNALGQGIRFMTNVNGVVYFNANDGATGYDLWRSDGTSAGTYLVLDLPSSTNISQQSGNGPINITEMNGNVYFTTNSPVQALWNSNGTSSGTTKISLPTTLHTNQMVNVNGTLYFPAYSQAAGRELWSSGGTPATTRMVHDLMPGDGNSSPRDLINHHGTLLFLADSPTLGRELWTSDGTSGGTVVIADVVLGSGDGTIQNITTAGNNLFFSAITESTGRELWVFQNPIQPRLATIRTLSQNGIYSTGQSVNITLYFNKEVSLSGGPMMVRLNTGAEVLVEQFSGSALSITHTIQAGESAALLNVNGISLSPGATLRDFNNADALLGVQPINLAETASIVVNPLPPSTLVGVFVNLGSIQRSQLDSIILNLQQPVNVATLGLPGAISLTQTAGKSIGTIVQTGASNPTGRITLTPAVGITSSIILTFSNPGGVAESAGVEHGSLTDGRWQLSIPYFSYVSELNHPTMRRLFGDINNSGQVDSIDFAEFGRVFGLTLANSPFDFDGNGFIDHVDFAAFGSRFGVSL